MLGQVEDPTAATLEWSSILLRSFLMEAGLSMVEMEAPYMSYYMETGSSLVEAGGGYGARLEQQEQKQDEEDDDDDEMQHLVMQQKKNVVDNVMAVEGMMGSASGSSATDEIVSVATPWLDPRLWSKLPEKLVERVLACLPLPSFFRSRLVCKRWYSLLFSDSFLEVCAKVRPARPWFLLFRRGVWSEAFVFDAVGKAWFRIDLSFLPPRFSVVASAGGLLCCISEARGCKTVLVCNPLTRACVQLPSALKERFVPTVGLVVDRDSKVYRVVAAGDDLISPFAVKNLTTELYDSRCQQWRMTAPLPRLCNLESGKTTYANGFFYCMNYSPFSVLVYDTEQGVWSKIQAPMRRFLRTPNLVECRGRLVLVAAVEKNKLNVPKSIRIWGLQHSRTSWVELERMPQGLYEEFMSVSGHKAFSCIGHGNLILITLPDSPEMLLYDFYEKVWRWAPRCPFANLPPAAQPPGSVSPSPQGFQAFAFDPRLEASVY